MKVPTPMRYVGGYELHLYCDTMSMAHHYSEFPHRYFGDDKKETFAKAKAGGWQFHTLAQTATCPKCSGMKRHGGK